MNPKILIILVVVIVFGAAGFFLYQNSLSGGGNVLAKNDFSIEIPEGWAESAASAGVSAIVVNAGEEVTDPAAEKINFRTYYAVTYDVLGGKTQEEYPQYFKEALEESVPGIEFVAEGALEGKDAYAIQADISQQGADFRIWFVIYKGEGDGIWIVSFNTPKSSWEGYKDLFYRVAASFEVR